MPQPSTRTTDHRDARRRQRVIDFLLLSGLKLLAWVAWLIPWPVWHLVASLLGMVAMLFGWRRVVLANVRHVSAPDKLSRPRACYVGSQQIATHLKTLIGILKASVRLPDPDDVLDVRGVEHLQPYLGQRGIIVVAPHTGPFPSLGLLATEWFRRRGYTGEVAAVARLNEPLGSRAVMDWFRDCLGAGAVTIIPIDTEPRTLGRRLKSILDARGMVILLVDEPTPAPSLRVPFFDDSIALPIGPVRLARATNSIIIPCAATYGRARKATLAVEEGFEAGAQVRPALEQVARALEAFVREHSDQWSMLSPVWASEKESVVAREGCSYADLHLHTSGSDGLCGVDDWVQAAPGAGVAVVAVTDHDHIETIRRWRASGALTSPGVLPGVELTARGRIVHLGVLFPEAVPDSLPPPGTPLLEAVRWARDVPGSLVVLVHPLPLLWRVQLRRMARAGLLPDAMETRFPLVGWRTPALERAAARYGVATLGGSDAHLTPRQLGRHVTVFAGETTADLVAAIRARTTEAATLPARGRPPLSVYGLQCLYSWLLPFQGLGPVAGWRAGLLRAARARRAPLPDAPAVVVDAVPEVAPDAQ